MLIVMMCSIFFACTACDLQGEKPNGDSTNIEQTGGNEEEKGENETETPDSSEGEEQKGKPVNPIQNGGTMNFD